MVFIMRPSDERKALRELRGAIKSLQSLDPLLLGVFARDDQPSKSDGFAPSSLGGGSNGKGGHSDRTFAQATRNDPEDEVHTSAVEIVTAIHLIHTGARKVEAKASRLTSHRRSTK